MQPRIIFMGTPDFAVPILRELAVRIDREALLVVTQPDRAAGRGRKPHTPPVKVEAERLGLEVAEIETFRDPAIRERLNAFAPELAVVAAFGRILPRWALGLPVQRCVNIHASLLPRFRGASPIAAAIACGDAQTGVALMEMEPGLDTGPVYAVDRIDIEEQDTTARLTGRLSDVGARLLGEHLSGLLAGDLKPTGQRGEVIETRRIEKAHGAIDWSRPAAEIERHVRAMWPWPRAWTVSEDGVRLQVHDAEVVDGGEREPGTVLGHDDRGINVATGDGSLRLVTVQIAGKAAQRAPQLAQHAAFAMGTVLSPGEGFMLPDPWIVRAGTA